MPAIDVVAYHDGVFVWSRGDCDFDLGVGGCEFWEEGFDEPAAEFVVSDGLNEYRARYGAYFMPLELPNQSQ